MLDKIEPQLQEYPLHQSIQYLESIIYENLNPEIYKPTVRISKIRSNLLGEDFKKSDLNTADRLFTELLTVLNELYQIMKQ